MDLFDSLLAKTRFVGEIGLDGSPELRYTWERQETVFNHILEACSSLGGKIISIHSRRASSQVIDSLRMHPNCGIPIFHWFSGPLKDLKIAIDLGCWFSIGPQMVKSNNGIRICAEIPKDRVLPESDGPFVRIGKNTVFPWDTTIVVKELASLWDQPEEKVTEQMHLNKEKILGS